MLTSALEMPVARDDGSVALKYAPRPLTAACHRSSVVVSWPLTGTGQLQTVPAVCHEQSPEPAVKPSFTETKSPVVSVR